MTAGGVLLPANAAQAATTTNNVKTAVTGTAKVNTTKAVAQSKAAKQAVKAASAVTWAKKQIGDPYRYGATGPGSFDCSGLMQYAWNKAGVKIPRVTYSQYSGIKKKISWSNLKPGDLMFFSGKGHVGMYVGNGKMVHSPSTGKTVRIEKLSSWRKSAFSGAVRPGA